MTTCQKLPFLALLKQLLALAAPMPVEELADLLIALMLRPGELDPFIRFDPAHYRRNPVAEGPHFQMIVVCWLLAQKSPIHSHDGSACGLVVVSGRATETLYDVTTDPTQPRATKTRVLCPGDVTASFDQDSHRITAADGDLVTLHVYTPALRTMTLFPDECPSLFSSPNPSGRKAGLHQ